VPLADDDEEHANRKGAVTVALPLDLEGRRPGG